MMFDFDSILLQVSINLTAPRFQPIWIAHCFILFLGHQSAGRGEDGLGMWETYRG